MVMGIETRSFGGIGGISIDGSKPLNCAIMVDGSDELFVGCVMEEASSRRIN